MPDGPTLDAEKIVNYPSPRDAWHGAHSTVIYEVPPPSPPQGSARETWQSREQQQNPSIIDRAANLARYLYDPETVARVAQTADFIRQGIERIIPEPKRSQFIPTGENAGYQSPDEVKQKLSQYDLALKARDQQIENKLNAIIQGVEEFQSMYLPQAITEFSLAVYGKTMSRQELLQRIRTLCVDNGAAKKYAESRTLPEDVVTDKEEVFTTAWNKVRDEFKPPAMPAGSA